MSIVISAQISYLKSQILLQINYTASEKQFHAFNITGHYNFVRNYNLYYSKTVKKSVKQPVKIR